jgi:hypothetical protein
VKLCNEEYDADAPRMGSVPYKSAVGSLMYAMVATWADLAFAISTVSQHMAILGWSHWDGGEEDHEIPQGQPTLEVAT